MLAKRIGIELQASMPSFSTDLTTLICKQLYVCRCRCHEAKISGTNTQFVTCKIMLCTICRKYGCSSCLLICHCGQIVCNKCRLNDEFEWLPCGACGEIVCSGCSDETCEVCLEKVCALEQCGVIECDGGACLSCVERCSVCNEYRCIPCYKKCLHCDVTMCKDCFGYRSCLGCTTTTRISMCNLCSPKCGVCNKSTVTCSKHSTQCTQCQVAICGEPKCRGKTICKKCAPKARRPSKRPSSKILSKVSKMAKS